MKAAAFARSFGWAIAGLALVSSASANYESQLGYRDSAIADTIGQFVLIGGLDTSGEDAYYSAGTNVWAVSLTGGSTAVIGTLPPNVSAGFLRFRDGDLHASYDQSYAPPFPSRHGVIDLLGDFHDYGGLDGIYDAAVNSSNQMFIAANPGAAGAKIFRFEPATTSVVEIAHIGSFSGGIAFDAQDRLYVATQTGDGIIRFTAAQVAAGGLAISNSAPIVPVTASYLCFDHNGRLYAVSAFGNKLAQYDAETGAELRVIAIDAANGYGIGRIHWDTDRRQLLSVYSDFNTFDSELLVVRYAESDEGIPGTSSVFRGWAAAWRDFIRPDTNSGGYAQNAAGAPTNTPSAAILGKPASFDPMAFPLGNILSLGNGGSIVLEFEDAIVNKPGPDFAVFENAFVYNGLTFAELAYIEVATTTNAWARFPVTYHPTNLSMPFGPAFALTDVTGVDGLAGKHTVPFGTPFDLEWLRHHPNVTNGLVNLDRIAFIRITDVIGDGSTSDDFGNPILDPYTATTSSTDGFDLRGVGVLNLAGLSLTMGPGGPVASWHTYEGRTYQPQVNTNGTWVDYGLPIPGTGGVIDLALPPSHDVALFRVEQTIPPSP